jgi:hypothetical protein
MFRVIWWATMPRPITAAARLALVALTAIAAIAAAPGAAVGQGTVPRNAELRVSVQDTVPAPKQLRVRYLGLRADTVIVRDLRARVLLPLPVGVVERWEIREGRLGRMLRSAFLVAAGGGFLGAASGFSGSTKVNYAGRMSDNAMIGAAIGGVIGAFLGSRTRWRTVEVMPTEVGLMAWTPGLGDVPVVERELPVVSPGRDVITYSELEAANVSTAAEAIQRLRPQFLRPKGSRSLGQESSAYPVLYVDASRVEELNALHAISIRTVQEIRYYSPAEATSRWGTGHEYGAILVVSRR